MEIDHTKIDWELLKDQKQILLQTMDDLDNEVKHGLISEEHYRERIDGLGGILGIIDYIQDTSVDGGYIPEKEVFNLHDDG